MDLENPTAPILDADQLRRIESVHRGFLYQHLYAVGCLFLALRAGAESIVVERDEDIEIVFPGRMLYVQVKTRSDSLTFSDIKSAIERFDALRLEHQNGKRRGSAEFVIVANVCPGPALLKLYEASDWPQDVSIQWPGNAGPIDKVWHACT